MGYSKSLHTRAQLLEAALAEAADTGLRNASVTRIAARANVAVGSVNYHFGSRDKLLREAMLELLADLDVRTAAADAEARGGDFQERWRARLLVYVQYVRTNPSYVRLMDEIKFLEPEMYQIGVTKRAAAARAMLREGIEEGAIRAAEEPELTAQVQLLVGARHFLEQAAHEFSSDEAVVDLYLRLILHGIGTPLLDNGTPAAPGRPRGRSANRP